MKKIYIKLLDGATVYVPCQAIQLTNKNFQIKEIKELDLKNDITAIWEFLPGDIVESKFNDEKNILIANKLISLSNYFPERKTFQLIYKIVNNLGKISYSELSGFEEEIAFLLNTNEILQKKHPLVDKWLNSL